MNTETIREALALGSAIKTHNSLRLREAKDSCTRALAALDAHVKVPDELDQDVEDFGSSMYAAGWNAFRDALLCAQ